MATSLGGRELPTPPFAGDPDGRGWRGRLVDHLGQILVGVSVICLAALALGLFGLPGSGAGGPSPEPRIRSNVQYIVRDDGRSGVWALASPVMERFVAHSERPINARRWIANTKRVIVVCAAEGTPYEVKLNGSYVRWRWFAQLQDGSWFPLAGFAETAKDGPQGLVPC